MALFQQLITLKPEALKEQKSRKMETRQYYLKIIGDSYKYHAYSIQSHLQKVIREKQLCLHIFHRVQGPFPQPLLFEVKEYLELLIEQIKRFNFLDGLTLTPAINPPYREGWFIEVSW